MRGSDMLQSYLIPDVVIPNIDVLRASVDNGFVRKKDSRSIIIENMNTITRRKKRNR